jgi:acyl phosphate:glycerol-3-phosphate acyltransferase
MIMLWLLTLTTAYLLGSIPFGYLLVRFVQQQDVRDTGSGNIGATNVARAGGATLGAFTLLLDAMKGFIAAFLAMQFAPNTVNGPSTLAIAAAVAAVVGHVFPVWLRFRGGKGIATALGVFIALVPLVALSSVGVFALIVATTRLVSLGSILAAVSIPFLAILLVPHRSPALLAGLSFISLLSIVKHHANIVRLLKGTESRFGRSKNSDSSDKENTDPNDKENTDPTDKKVNA